MNPSLPLHSLPPLLRSLRWGLIFSLCLHLALLILPGLHLPGTDAPPETDSIDTLLLPAAPPPQAVPRPPAHSEKTAPAVQPTPTAPASGAAVPATPPTEAAPQQKLPSATAPPSPPAVEAQPLALPGKGRLRFSVHWGENGGVVGEAVHEWSVADGHYKLSSSARTVGLAALFRSVQTQQRSEGEIDTGGLRPRDFRNDKNGASDSAHFDWENRRILLGKEQREEPLQAGAQDLLSMFYQFAQLPLREKTFQVWVSTGRKLERYTFEIVGEEALPFKSGTLRTLHLRTQGGSGSDKTEVWLALDYKRLPVKIRYIDKKNTLYEQIVEDIDIDPKAL